MIERPRPQKYTLRLSHLEKVSNKVYLKRFEVVEPSGFTFLAGQTVMLHVAPGVNRSMSIASPPADNTGFWVAHDVSPMGPYSKWTLDAKVGDTMTCMAPLGMFVLDRESPRKKVFVATGTGIAPFRAMLLEQLSSNNELNAECTNKNPSFTLYWGLRKEEDIFWKQEFDALAANHPNFRFVLTLSQPSDSWKGKVGRVTDHVFFDESSIPESDFYLCGSKAMVNEMEEKLLIAGVPKAQVKKEFFY